MKIEAKIPKMLSEGANRTTPPTKAPKDMKDVDGGTDKEKAKRKKVAASQMPAKPDGGSMSLGGPMSWKPPTKKEMHKSAVHSEAMNSMRKWVAGDIPTKQHQETVTRATKALKHSSSYGLGIKR